MIRQNRGANSDTRAPNRPRSWKGNTLVDLLEAPVHRMTTKEKRCWVPRRCKITNKWLFLRQSVEITETITGPGTPVILKTWVRPEAYTILVLRGFTA